LALVAAIVILEMIGSFEFFKRGYRLQALFDNVLELKVGDAVKMAGKQVGRVERIEFADSKVRVVMKVDARAPIKTNSKATIKFAGLMGQNYVALSFGSDTAPRAENDTNLQTVEQADLNALMAKLDKAASGVEEVTKNLSGQGLSNFLGPLTDFVKENKDKISGTISNFQTISANIAQGKGTVGKLINEDTLYQTALTTVTNFNETATDIKGAIAEAKTTLTRVNAGRGTLGRLTQDESLFNEATNAVTNLRQIFEKINRGQGSVGKLVNDESLIKNARMTLQKLDKAAEGLEDQGPLSVLGIAVSHLF
jgi:phospholipid/cholesterol/gamma-HCH transport system substrate-binding protein